MTRIPITYCKIMDSKCPAYQNGMCKRFEPCQYEEGINLNILGIMVSKILEHQAALETRQNEVLKMVGEIKEHLSASAAQKIKE